MHRRYVTADVFTDRAFGGNPLAVVLEAEGLATAQMQAIANEFNYSETVFVLPPSDPAHDAQVRIFMPGKELPFAGHPNVGAALVLARRRTPAPARLLFEELAGLVALDIALDDGRPVAAELTAPQPFHMGGEAGAAEVAAAVGLSESDILTAAHAPVVGSVGLPFLFAELASRDALRRARPVADLLAVALTAAGTDGVFLYTRDSAGAGFDIQSRMFFQAAGFLEDPATGSANTALAGLLAALAPDADGAFAYAVGQGEDMGRPSRLLARAVKRAGVVVSTHVGGGAVEMMAGAVWDGA